MISNFFLIASLHLLVGILEIVKISSQSLLTASIKWHTLPRTFKFTSPPHPHPLPLLFGSSNIRLCKYNANAWNLYRICRTRITHFACVNVWEKVNGWEGEGGDGEEMRMEGGGGGRQEGCKYGAIRKRSKF